MDFLNVPSVDLTEFNKLVEMLKANDIPFEKEVFIDPGKRGAHLAIPDLKSWKDERLGCSVICRYGSYGWEKGLLEIWAPGINDGVEGYLTTEGAYQYIVDTRNGIPRTVFDYEDDADESDEKKIGSTELRLNGLCSFSFDISRRCFHDSLWNICHVVLPFLHRNERQMGDEMGRLSRGE